MTYFLDITVELLSPVNPSRIRAFCDQIEKAIEAAGLWNEGPPPDAIELPRNYKGNLASPYPYKGIRLSYGYLAGTYHWRLNFCSYTLALSDADIRQVLSAVKVCQVESVQIARRSLEEKVILHRNVQKRSREIKLRK